jgi:amino acid transporter
MSPLRKDSIGMFSLICLVIGNMIGAGVYISSSYALQALHDARLVLLVWCVGGLHACCGAIAYAALARRVQISGGEYTFLSKFVHPAIGFMAGWISLVAGFTAPIAAAALVFGGYVCETPRATTWAQTVATLMILLGALFHSMSLKAGTNINNLVVGLKFVGFGLFISACLYHLSSHSYSGYYLESPLNESAMNSGRPSLLAEVSKSGVLTTMLVQLFYVALAYTGFNASIYIAGEFEDSRSNRIKIARSMILAAGLVTMIYLILNALFLYSSPPEIVAKGLDYFVSDVANHVGGAWLKWVIRITIALSSATSVLAMLATGPRVYVQMARDGALPQWLLSESSVPRNAIWIQTMLSIGLVWLSSVRQLIEYLGLTLTACGALAVASLWIAYRKFSAIEPIRWYEHLALTLYLTGAIALLATAATTSPFQFWCCIATFGSGLVVYLIRSKRPAVKEDQ